MHFQRILIATDFSDASRIAVLRGIDLAKQFGAEIHLFHAVPISQVSILPPIDSAPTAEDWLGRALDHAEMLMVELVADLNFGECKVTKEVREADFAASGVLHYAEEVDADLLVLGTHGRRGLRRVVMGSVAEEIVRTAPCAVFSCTSDVDEVSSWPREILVAVDFSDASRQALSAARGLAAMYRTPVRALHVVPRPHYAPEYATASGSLVLENLPGVLEAAEKSLRKEIEGHGPFPNGIDVEITVGGASQEIIETAAERQVGLIVVGNRGLSGFKHLLLGSVADRVVRLAACPVLTVHQDETSTQAEAHQISA